MRIKELNKDQLDGLAQLCFDLAKGAFAFVLLPSVVISDYPLIFIAEMISGLIFGLVFVYVGLILLKAKEGRK